MNLSQEDFDIITEQGMLLNSEGELAFSGFYRMILGQMRSFTNRKVVNALNKAQDDNASEQLFALCIIMANIESLSSRIDSIAPPPVTKEKSMKEILKKWNQGPMIKCFNTWKSYLFIDLCDVRELDPADRISEGWGSRLNAERRAPLG